MTEIFQNSTIPATPPVAPVSPAPVWKNLLEKIKPRLISILNNFSKSVFYQNKKIFWPISIAFGLVFLVIILGLLFGKHNTVQPVTKTPTPAPTIQATPEATSSGDVLLDSKSKLNDLNKQIKALDVKESTLQPPTLNFNIKF